MTTGFAGSRCLDDRRRRRLAGEADAHELNAHSAPPQPGDNVPQNVGAEADRDEMPAADEHISHFPVGRLISPKLWKLWAVGLLGLLVGGNLLFAGTAATTADGQFGPGFAFLFDLRAGRALKPFATLLLLLATQLAWFIGWVRSRSPRDFAGRYRLWHWCAALGMAATLAVAGNLHQAWSQTALWLWDLDFWNKEILVWLLPVCLAATWALRTLHREMRDCPSSLTMLWMAAACGLCVAMLKLDVVNWPLSADDMRVLNWGTQLSACWLLFMSLLLHARHVVHVTADPARIRPAVFRLKSILRRPQLPLGRKPAKQTEETTRPTQPTPKPLPAQAKLVDNQQAVAVEPTELPKADAVIDEAMNAPKTLPVDGREQDSPPANLPTNANSMKGLSKRERRRLRKQQKDAERLERQAG